jgi:hypothetical protein
MPIIMVTQYQWYGWKGCGSFLSARPWVVATSIGNHLFDSPARRSAHYYKESPPLRGGRLHRDMGTVVTTDGGGVRHSLITYHRNRSGTSSLRLCTNPTWTPWTGWAFGFGFGWAMGAAWGSSCCWGYAAAPYWGAMPYGGFVRGPYGGAAAWGPGGWAATTGNVYSHWGATTAVSRGSAGYNAWTGNAWASRVGTSYNSVTGRVSAGQRAGVQNVYTGNYAYGQRGATYNRDWRL